MLVQYNSISYTVEACQALEAGIPEGGGAGRRWRWCPNRRDIAKSNTMSCVNTMHCCFVLTMLSLFVVSVWLTPVKILSTVVGGADFWDENDKYLPFYYDT